VEHAVPGPLRIYAFAEYYPDPFKPYFDTQFADWVALGHDLSVFAFGTWGDVGNPPVARYRLAERTAYLPTGAAAVGRALPRIASALVADPRRALRALRAGTGSLRRRALHAAQSTLLPSRAPDLCLVHNLTTATRLVSLRRLYPGARVALYYHGGETAGAMAPADAMAAFAQADVVFTNTEYSARSLRERGCPPGKIHVVPLGYDLREFTPPDDRAYTPEGTVRLIAASRLSVEKGLTVLLDALAAVTGAGQSVICTIVGDGPERAALEGHVRALGLGDRVRFTGVLPRNRVLDEFAHADALVLPSVPTPTWEENQACVVQEAMLSRLIVVTTRTGGVPESIAPAMDRFAAAPGDAAALAAAITRVSALTAAEFDALGRSNRAFCEARYDVRSLNAELLALAFAGATGHDRSPVRG